MTGLMAAFTREVALSLWPEILVTQSPFGRIGRPSRGRIPAAFDGSS